MYFLGLTVEGGGGVDGGDGFLGEERRTSDPEPWRGPECGAGGRIQLEGE